MLNHQFRCKEVVRDNVKKPVPIPVAVVLIRFEYLLQVLLDLEFQLLSNAPNALIINLILYPTIHYRFREIHEEK
jgi:hypothetical protein